MISLRGLTKQYGSTRAVDDLTFDVRPGRVTGFLGPNGAGKSTIPSPARTALARIGVIVRHSAGAVAVLFAILLVLPTMTEGLPDSLQETVNPHLPAYAGQAIFRTSESGHLLQPWQGFARPLFTAYTAATLVVATIIIISRRDT